MLGSFQLGQLAFAAFIALVIAERVRYLVYRAPASEQAARWLLQAIKSGDRAALAHWSRARPESHAAQLIAPLLSDRGSRDEADEVASELYEAASARLMLLRVSATLASTTGLLGGILALARGSASSAGLWALSAGGAERHNLDEAIATMAIGVALSALCFQALGLLRPAAQRLVMQTAQLARALGTHPARRAVSSAPSAR